VLGLHYPTDVLAGGSLGAVIGTAATVWVGA
jgi:membrane-associated phospholipid phosphatase